MTELLFMLIPELILAAAACVLLLMGCSTRLSVRRLTPYVTMVALLVSLALAWSMDLSGTTTDPLTGGIRLDALSYYIRILSLAVGVVLLLLAWPTNADRTGNSALHFGRDAGEFYGMFLLSLAGLLLVAGSNDLIVLFLTLELVSIPTYIMVSMSRPLPVAQEAGVKYFFLGAMSVAVMLFGFSYLYGTTGAVNLEQISTFLRRDLAENAAPVLTNWQKLALILVLLGFAFKMAAFPLHFYAGDVYEGAATPVTAFLAFVPKAAGFVALVRVLWAVGGENFALPGEIILLLWVLAALTMTVGNVLGLLQNNVKRVLAYSSIAHSGYMLVGIAALASAGQGAGTTGGNIALQGVLFYLAAYGVMNAGAFGVLMLLPARRGEGSAETFDDLAGQGRRHVALGLVMAISCFSLIGIPLTAGFIGKVLLIWPAFQGGLFWLVVVLVINAAISAAYYLRIVAVMFLRPEGAASDREIAWPSPLRPQIAVLLGVVLSAAGTIVLGAVPPAAEGLARSAAIGANLERPAHAVPTTVAQQG